LLWEVPACWRCRYLARRLFLCVCRAFLSAMVQSVELPRGGDLDSAERVCSTTATVTYQAASVPTGLHAQYVYPPKVGVRRDHAGNDVEVFGVQEERVPVKLMDARLSQLNLDMHGVHLLPSNFLDIDYYDIDQVLSRYYPECCRLVSEVTGARRVLAFDHNIRSTSQHGRSMGGGFVAQRPLGLVHGDYTEASARNRVRQLTAAPGMNDTLRRTFGELPPLDEPSGKLLDARFMLVNVWRSIHPRPVERNPLAILNPQSVPLDDIIVHEIHYEDRIGENYNARFRPGHEWWYFPKMRREEALLLKCWDSAGELAREQTASGSPRVPATFAFHAAADVPVPGDAPPRESIEVRLAVFF